MRFSIPYGLLAILFFYGCTPSITKNGRVSQTKNKDAVERAALNWEVEYYSAKDLALQEVMKTPTTFPVLHEEDYYVWERAFLFLKNNTKGIAWNDRLSEDLVVLTSDAENNEERFQYEISKKRTPDGFNYTVNCYTWDHIETPTALLNAKNLARFMRRGELEGDLLVH
ncbi:MAG: hypothetical protein SGJ02_06840 [bacterium]|nr:hypothetical protein [bacterium]